MAGISRLTLADQVADALVALIRERDLREGDPIPATGDLSETFNVSRTVVREAIAELAGRGLLKRQQGRESVVTAPGGEHLERLLRYRLDGAGVDLDVLQEYREMIEVGSARLAARHATTADIDRLGDRLAAMRQATTEGQLHDADVAFHEAVALASGNELLQLTLEGITPLLRQLREHVWAGWIADGRDVEPILDAHSEVLRAIEAHDEVAAGQAMEANLGQARLGLEKKVAPTSADGSAPLAAPPTSHPPG